MSVVSKLIPRPPKFNYAQSDPRASIEERNMQSTALREKALMRMSGQRGNQALFTNGYAGYSGPTMGAGMALSSASTE